MFAAVLLALIYGFGAISLGLRLWYIKDPWEPVLGQLPHDFLLIDAFSGVVIPDIIAGVCAYFLFKWLWRDAWRTTLVARDGSLKHIRILILAAILALVPLGLLHLNYQLTGVIRPYWQIYLLCLFLNIAMIYLALGALLLVREHEEKTAKHRDTSLEGHYQATVRDKAVRAGIRMAIAALALLPFVTVTFAAATPLPVVYLCGSPFNHVDTVGRHYATGNLIGLNGQWVYIAETRLDSIGKSGENIYIGNYIAVIPLSVVQLEAIGQEGECNNLAPAGKQNGPPTKSITGK